MFAHIRKWTHWDLNPGPSACEADVIPLHHVPLRRRGAKRLCSLSCAILAWGLRTGIGEFPSTFLQLSKASAGLRRLQNALAAALAPDARKQNAETRDRTGDLQIFGLTLSQLSYRGHVFSPDTLECKKLSLHIQEPSQPHIHLSFALRRKCLPKHA